MNWKTAVVVGAVAVGALWAGRVTAQQGAYAGGAGMVGVAAVKDWTVAVVGDTATVSGVVVNVSNVTLANVVVTVWDNDFVAVPVGTLGPGRAAEFVAVMQGGPNWAWQATVTADVVRAPVSIAQDDRW